MAQIYFRREREMKSRKPKTEPSLLDQMGEPLRDIVKNLKANAACELEKLRERDSAKYLEFAAKILPLVAALNPGADDFSDCNDMRSIGVKLLKSVGCPEYEMTEDAIADALKANDAFIERLQAIRNAAEPMQ